MSPLVRWLAATPPGPGQGSAGQTGLVSGLVFVAFVLTVLALAIYWVARPWELRGGSFVDKLRIGEAVSSYDFWLSLRGVGTRRRRELRTELRSNLWEAAQQVGARQAISAVGPLRQLAYASVVKPGTPRWGHGVAAGLVALELLVMFQLFISTVVVDTARATKAERADVLITLVPGMRTIYESRPDGGLSFETQFGPAPLVVAAVAFLIASRPWLLLRGRRSPRAE